LEKLLSKITPFASVIGCWVGFEVVFGDFLLVSNYLQGKSMVNRCPSCRSERVETRNLARKAGGLIGTVGGTVGGAISSLSGAEFGMTVGVVAGPPGMVMGGLLGALVGSLVGGTACGLAGAQLGEMVDQRVLDNFHCLACGYTFGNSTSNAGDCLK